MANRTQLLTIEVDKLTSLRGRLNKAAQEIIRIAEGELREYGSVLTTALQQEAPQREGLLQASIGFQILQPGTKNLRLQVFIGSKERPPVVVNTILFGSKPHRIPKTPGRGRHPGPVSFFWDKVGRRVTFRQVRHPGTKPNPFHERAWERTMAQRLAMIDRIGRLTVEQIIKPE